MTTYVIADLHFGDEGVCSSGSLSRLSARPFGSAREMEAEITRRWNVTVTDEDVVFVLGDVGKRSRVNALGHLRGRKHLIAGNADDLLFLSRAGVFASISVAKWVPGALLTHIPVHPSQLRGSTRNIHGHLHKGTLGDQRFVCVSVEQTRYAPVPLASVLAPRSQTGLVSG